MKSLYLLILMMCLGISVFSQEPGGGFGGRRGGGGSHGMPPDFDKKGSSGGNEEIFVMNIPDLPDINPNQKSELAKLLVKERKEIDKCMGEKMALRKDERTISPKKRVSWEKKVRQKTEKIDKKINKIGVKYDKKYRNLLTERQYEVFMNKKSSIQFKHLNDDRNVNFSLPEEREGGREMRGGFPGGND